MRQARLKPSKVPTGLARNVSIRGLAKKIARVTKQDAHAVEMRLRRQLFHWLEQDVATGAEPWMVRPAGARTWRINLAMLRSLHPAFFEDPTPKDLDARVSDHESRIETLEWENRAMATQIGKIRGWMKVQGIALE